MKKHENLDLKKYEKELWHQGYTYIAGIDDVGRGCFAGPVVCASVIFPKTCFIEGIMDSKQIPKKKHAYFVEQIKKEAIAFGIGIVSERIIEEINIKKASQLAMKHAVEAMSIHPHFLLIDGKEVVDLPIPQRSLIKGDTLSHSIAAASLLAKEFRDRLMTELDDKFGGIYGWRDNAGYPTEKHMEAVRDYGSTEHHRRTWKKCWEKI